MEPTHKKALFIRASSYLKKSLFKETIDDSNNLVNLGYSEAFYIRGCAYEKLGEIQKAIDDFTTLLSIYPNHVNAAYARGACENKRGNFAQAIEDYNMALSLDKERGINMSSPSIRKAMKNQDGGPSSELRGRSREVL